MLECVVLWTVWDGCLCFFKQKTAYELGIRDGSADVCSSDLVVPGGARRRRCRPVLLRGSPDARHGDGRLVPPPKQQRRLTPLPQKLKPSRFAPPVELLFR